MMQSNIVIDWVFCCHEGEWHEWLYAVNFLIIVYLLDILV